MKKLVTVMSLLTLLMSGCGQETSQSSNPNHLQATSEGYTATVEMTPGKVGPNDYTVTITDSSNQLSKDGQAILHFSMTGMEHGKSKEELQLDTDGKWHSKGPHIMMEGTWNIQLEWDQPSKKKLFFDFSTTIEE